MDHATLHVIVEVRQRPDTSRRLIQNIEVQLTGLARGGSREIMCTWYKVLGRVLHSKIFKLAMLFMFFTTTNLTKRHYTCQVKRGPHDLPAAHRQRPLFLKMNLPACVAFDFCLEQGTGPARGSTYTTYKLTAPSSKTSCPTTRGLNVLLTVFGGQTTWHHLPVAHQTIIFESEHSTAA